MNRFDIINRIGDKYRVGNTETGEFSYAQALKTVGKDIKDYQKATTGTQHKFLDIRFENERLVVLVECKNKFSRWDKAKIQGQLQDYVRFEKAYSDKKIVAILAETDGDEVWVWFGQSVIIDDEHRMEEETVLRTFEEYENLCFGRVNDKIKVVDSIKTLNEKLHSDGINEKLRSQFVGTCLLALKNGLVYKNVKETLDPKTGKKLAPERVVLKSIKDILEGLLTRGGSLNKAGKLAVLNSKVLDDQDVTSLTYKELEDILQFIDDNVVPYINDKSTAGQDLLNLFFTTFNKYVGKSDKNQAFTPDHICDFMSKAVGVNKNSRVLDPCCGSGAFLVRAMTDAMDDCDTEEEREEVKKNQIFGIEYEEGAFGLSSTNMLIHGDGNSNDVINTIVETKLVPVPSLVDGYYHLYFDAPDTIYGLDATIRDVLDLDYSQFRAAIEFLYPEAEFSTEHGVKGEEYDNVVFVISKGWNQYQFETYAPMITGRTPIPNGKQTSYERNRNLFYVCCSRPRKRLFFFVSVPIDASFRVFLDDLVGAENIYTYGQYLEAKQ